MKNHCQWQTKSRQLWQMKIFQFYLNLTEGTSTLFDSKPARNIRSGSRQPFLSAQYLLDRRLRFVSCFRQKSERNVTFIYFLARSGSIIHRSEPFLKTVILVGSVSNSGDMQCVINIHHPIMQQNLHPKTIKALQPLILY